MCHMIFNFDSLNFEFCYIIGLQLFSSFEDCHYNPKFVVKDIINDVYSVKTCIYNDIHDHLRDER